MKRVIATIAAGILLCVAGAARAERYGSRHQKGRFVLLGIDTEFSVPLGNYADANSVGGGVMFIGEHPLMETVGITARVGFIAHVDRTIGTGLGAHVHTIPFLVGTKYYVGGERHGLFGAFELGMFDLMTGRDRRVGANVVTDTSNDVKFGLGVGVGYQEERWNARLNVHSQDVGNFGSAFAISGGIGYQFGSL